MSWNSFDLCSYSFCPYGDKAFLNRESLSCGPSMPPGLCLILWCCTSGWACLYWRLASDWWGSKLGGGGGRSNGPAGRSAMQPLVGCDSEHSTGTTHWQAHNIMLKCMTCLASGFEKCQKSVYKQCTSPAITGFRRLTGSSGRERSPDHWLGKGSSGECRSNCATPLQRGVRAGFQSPSAPLKGTAVLW